MSKSYTDEEKEKAIGILCYEWDMLIYTSNQLKKKLEQKVECTYLESFLVHARGLIEFFSDKKKGTKPEDILAEKFFEPTKIWKTTKEECGCNLDFLMEKYVVAHKLLAHITMERIRDYADKKNWDVQLITRELLKLLSQFQTKTGFSILDVKKCLKTVEIGSDCNASGVAVGRLQTVRVHKKNK